MPDYIHPIVQGQPVSPGVPDVVPITPIPPAPTGSRQASVFQTPGVVAKIKPKIRAGEFWIQDRRHYLYSRKTTCYLEDITWFVFNLADHVIPSSEEVHVRGVDITGSTQYILEGNRLWVNGGAVNHPGTRWGFVNQDLNISNISRRDIILPTDSVYVEYDYNDWDSGTVATGAGNFIPAPGTAGIIVTPKRPGAWADNWTVVINAATGAPLEVTKNVHTQTIEVVQWDAAVVTVEDLIDALNAVNSQFDFEFNNEGDIADLLSVTVAALGGAPITETFTGGVEEGFVVTPLSENLTLGQAEIVYKFDPVPVKDRPVVITDDRMYHWDSRDIAPQFTVSEEGFLEFNVPRNYITNPDFEADAYTPSEWGLTGTPDVLTGTRFEQGLYPRSGTKYCKLLAGEAISHDLPAWGTGEYLLSIAIANNDSVAVDIEFFDINWNSLVTDNWTIAATGYDNWSIATRVFGANTNNMLFDFTPPEDAINAVITITATDTTYVDYVFWGRTSIVPDHWHPHPMMTVEYDTGTVDYYEFHPSIGYRPDGEPILNALPLPPTNLNGALNYETSGFLGIVDVDKPDFRAGAGGLNIRMPHVIDGEFLNIRPNVTGDPQRSTPDGDGGFFVCTTAGQLLHYNSFGEVDYSEIIANNVLRSLLYDKDTKILYIGGDFTTLMGVSRNRMASIEWDRRVVTDFNPDVSQAVMDISEAKPGQLIISLGSNTTTVGGQTRACFALVDKVTGALDQDFDPVISAGIGYTARYDLIHDLYICAGTIQTTVSNNLAALDQSGAPIPGFDPSPNNAVRTVDLIPEHGVAYVGGLFTTIYATGRPYAAKVDYINDALDAWDADVDDVVHDLRITADDSVYMVGEFDNLHSISTPKAGAVDGTTGSIVLDFRPDFTDDRLFISYSHGLVSITGVATTALGTSVLGWTIHPAYDFTELQGRRHIPTAKTDSLGKLSHEGILTYYSGPWTRETTWTGESAKPAEIQLHDQNFIMFRALGVAVDDGTAGDTTIDSTAVTDEHLVNAAIDRGVYTVVSDADNREVVRVKKYETGLFHLDTPLRHTYNGMQARVFYPVFSLLETEERWLRGRVLDGSGNPVVGKTVYIQVYNSDTVGVVNPVDITNQDGEFRFLLTGVDEGSVQPELISIIVGGLIKKVPVWVKDLP